MLVVVEVFVATASVVCAVVADVVAVFALEHPTIAILTAIAASHVQNV